MRKPKFHLSSDQINDLQGVYQGCEDVVSRIRYQAVRLYGQGYATAEVLAITGCSRTSLLKWCRRYRQSGVGGLVDHRNGGNSAKLGRDDLAQLTSYLPQYKPNQVFASDEYQGSGEFWTVSDLAQLLQRNYQVSYKSPNSYRTVLSRCGLSRQRPAASYQSRREAQVICFEETLAKNCSTRPKVPPIS